MDKLNIAELLKDCQSGIKLYTTVWGDVKFIKLCDVGMITVLPISNPYNTNNTKLLYSDGRFTLDGECVLFPSKNQRDWSKFHRPFKDGDIVCNIENAIIIYKKIDVKGFSGSFASLDRNSTFIPHYLAYLEDTYRFATEEEKQKLFDTIKSNGYKWNPETKTLEELILNKFDITTLNPFDKVLVRDNYNEPWNINYFSYIDSANMFKTIMGTYLQCIPYKDNEYLLGIADKCDNFYKTWK